MSFIFQVNEDAPKEDENVWAGIGELATDITTVANDNTDAPVGISWFVKGHGPDRVIRIGPKGAAAIAVEFGHQGVPARRPVKRALDQFRVS